MTPDDSLIRWIKRCEGFSTRLYKDTDGKLTIGWGRNLQDRGISVDEAGFMFTNDLARTISELEPFSWFNTQPDNVKNALINMNFNLGITRLLEFDKMIAALENNNYSLAAREALNSEWAAEVGLRAKDIALMMREGRIHEI